MRRPFSAALLGAGTGLFFSALQRILAASLWPREGNELLLLALLGAPFGAAAAFMMPRPEREGPRPEERSPIRTDAVSFLLLLGATLMASPLLACRDPRFPALAGIGLAVAAALFHAWRERRLPVLGTALLAAAAATFALRTGTIGERDIPGTEEGRQSSESITWSGDARIGVDMHEEGWGLLSVSGGLREIFFGPVQAREIPRITGRGEDGLLEVLSVGFPDGRLAEHLLSLDAVAIDVVEPDRAVARLILDHRPQLAEDPRVQVHTGSPRRFVTVGQKRYDLIVIAPRATPAAALAAALAFREDYLTTAEAFEAYLAALRPSGVIAYRGVATGRVVTTLRSAYSGPKPFSEGLVVFGRKKRAIAECYFRPSGFSAQQLREVNRYAVNNELAIFSSPETWRTWNLYQHLARDEHLEGLAFTGIRDLSPAKDERPFLGHTGRVIISPTGLPLPEDLGRAPKEWKMQFVPPEDWGSWKLLAAAFALLAVTVALPLFVIAHRSGLARHAAPYPLLFLLVGAGGAAALRSLLGWARWLEPSGGPASWIPGLFVAALGAGWMTAPSRSSAWKKAGLPLAALLALPGVAGYAPSSLPESPAAVGILLPALLTIAAGFLAGGFAGAHIESASDVIPESGAWHGAVTLHGAAAGWALSNLAAVTFGFPLLWLLASAATVTAAAAGRKL